MAKIQRNFRIEKDLDTVLKNTADAQGITVSQLIELACYSLVKIDKKSVSNCTIQKERKQRKMTISVNTDDNTYRELVKSATVKNTSLSQEVNFILRASLTNNSFSQLELTALYSAMIDMNKLGNLFKLSLNNNLNTPELLEDIGQKIDEVRNLFRQSIAYVKTRRI